MPFSYASGYIYPAVFPYPFGRSCSWTHVFVKSPSDFLHHQLFLLLPVADLLCAHRSCLSLPVSLSRIRAEQIMIIQRLPSLIIHTQATNPRTNINIDVENDNDSDRPLSYNRGLWAHESESSSIGTAHSIASNGVTPAALLSATEATFLAIFGRRLLSLVAQATDFYHACESCLQVRFHL